jgi:hypothetical protein
MKEVRAPWRRWRVSSGLEEKGRKRRTSMMKSQRHDSNPSLPFKPASTPAEMRPEKAPARREPQ